MPNEMNLEELERFYLNLMPGDLFSTSQRKYHPMLIMDNDKVLVNFKRSFDDYRLALAFSSYAGKNRDDVAASGCLAYQDESGSWVYWNSTEIDIKLDMYWEQKSEETVSRYFEDSAWLDSFNEEYRRKYC